jgi:preprotein translocase subunit YajC
MLHLLLSATTALAQQADGAAAKGPSMVEMLAMPAGFLLIMYFLIIRPQQKKAKEHSDLLVNLKAGDEVVTTGGIIGKIRSVAETFVTIDVASNTSIKVLKNNVTGLTKAPAAAGAAVKEPAKT